MYTEAKYLLTSIFIFISAACTTHATKSTEVKGKIFKNIDLLQLKGVDSIDALDDDCIIIDDGDKNNKKIIFHSLKYRPDTISFTRMGDHWFNKGFNCVDTSCLINLTYFYKDRMIELSYEDSIRPKLIELRIYENAVLKKYYFGQHNYRKMGVYSDNLLTGKSGMYDYDSLVKINDDIVLFQSILGFNNNVPAAKKEVLQHAIGNQSFDTWILFDRFASDTLSCL